MNELGISRRSKSYELLLSSKSSISSSQTGRYDFAVSTKLRVALIAAEASITSRVKMHSNPLNFRLETGMKHRES